MEEDTSLQLEEENDFIEKATELGCESIYVPGENGQSGHWHFTQQYDKG
jgi:hypothetical protein